MAITLGDAVLWLTADDEKLGPALSGAKTKTMSWATNLAGGISIALGGVVVDTAMKAAGAVVDAGAAVINFSGDAKQAQNDLVASLGLTEEEAARLGKVAIEVFKNNFGGSLEEANAALAETRRQLGDLSDEELQDATENAFRLSDVFGIDVSESLNAVKVLTEEFGLSQQEAFDFMTSGFQNGLDSSGDFIDSITEYGGLFGQGEATAGQFFSLLESGLQGGVLGTDKAADAFKEFQIRFLEGGDAAMGAIEELTGDGWGMFIDEIKAGDSTVTDVFGLMVKKLGEIEDPVKRNQLGVALLGTQFEDMGADAVAAIDLGTTSLEDMGGATDKLDAKYKNFGAMWEGIKRKALVALSPIGDKILGLANRVMPVVESAFGWFETVLPPLIDQAALVFDWLVQQIESTVVPFIQNTLMPVLQEFGDWFTGEGSAAMWEFLTPIQEIGQRIINEVVPAIIEFIIPLVQQVIPGLKLLGKIAFNIASVVFPLLVQWWNFLIDNINIVIPIVAALGAVIAALSSPITLIIGAVVLLATAWANNWGGIQEKTQAVMDFIMPFIEGAMEFIQDVVSTVLGAIQAWWNEHGEAVMTIVKAVWEFVVARIKFNIELAKAIIMAVATAIQVFWDAWGDTIMGMAALVWDNIKTIVSAAMDIIGFIIDAVAAVIEGDWAAFGEALKGIWTTVWEALKTIVGNAKAGLLLVVQDIVNAVKEKFVSIADGMIDVGASIIQGIEDGVTQNMASLLAIVTGLADTIIQEVMDTLGIGSPSKVFFEIGKNLQGSLILGMADNGGMAAGAGAITNTTINNFSQTINTRTGPGNSIGEFAAMQARRST